MRAPTNYAGPRRQQPKPKQVSQSVESKLSSQTSTVRDLLAQKGTDVITVAPSESLLSAVTLLREARLGAVVVMDEGDNVCGILSERDVIRILAGLESDLATATVGDLMTRQVKACAPDATLAGVLQAMTQNRFRHMPVIEHDRLAGIITIGDVVKHRLQELEQEKLGMQQVIVG